MLKEAKLVAIAFVTFVRVYTSLWTQVQSILPLNSVLTYIK